MRVPAICLLLMLTMAACGGSDDEAGDTDTTATTTATTEAAPTTRDDSQGSSGPSTDCMTLLQWATDSVTAQNAAFAGGGPNAVGMEYTADYFQAFADQAPDAIQRDMKTFADAFEAFFEELEALDIDFTDPDQLLALSQSDIETLEAAAEQLEAPEVEQALDNIELYFESECVGG